MKDWQDIIKIDKQAKVPLYHQINQNLRQLIEGGHLQPGDGVPSEWELSDLYGVSRLTVRRALGDRSGQAQTLNALGRAAYRAARYHDATGYHEQALTVSEDLGDRCQQADALDGLARAHEATGQSTQAHRHRRRADALRAELGEPADPGR